MIRPHAIAEHEGESLYLLEEKYRDNNALAILLMSDEGPYATLSINTDEELGDGEFVVNHDVSRNNSLMDSLLSCGAFEDTGRRVSYGYVTGQPVWRLRRSDDQKAPGCPDAPIEM
jgi:hypothetical protein